MSVLDNVLKKKIDELVCGNCQHPIIQDLESGKWYHTTRDTKDLCDFVDSKKNSKCKCDNATPFVSNKVIPSLTQPKQNVNVPERVQEEEHVVDSSNSIPRVSEKMPQALPEKNPVNVVLEYLLERRGFAIADALFYLELSKKVLLDSIKTGE